MPREMSKWTVAESTKSSLTVGTIHIWRPQGGGGGCPKGRQYYWRFAWVWPWREGGVKKIQTFCRRLMWKVWSLCCHSSRPQPLWEMAPTRDCSWGSSFLCCSGGGCNRCKQQSRGRWTWSPGRCRRPREALIRPIFYFWSDKTPLWLENESDNLT